MRRPWWDRLRSVTLQGAIDGMADCAELLPSMPFDGAVDRLELARPRTGSAGDRWRRPQPVRP